MSRNNAPQSREEYINSQVRLFSDFDGTMVGTKGWYSLRNWRKYPLKPMPGINEFLDGAEEGGLAISGIITKRKPISQRVRVTEKTIERKLHLTERFPMETVGMAGTDPRKGIAIVEKAKLAPAVLLEDKPHKLGVPILSAMRDYIRSGGAQLKEQGLDVVMGVVAHDDAAHRIEVLRQESDVHRSDLGVTFENERTQVINEHGGVGFANHNVAFRGDGFRLSVVLLKPYSFESGQLFAGQVQDIIAGRTAPDA